MSSGPAARDVSAGELSSQTLPAIPRLDLVPARNLKLWLSSFTPRYCPLVPLPPCPCLPDPCLVAIEPHRPVPLRNGPRPLTQMKPVAARATFWLTESLSAGRDRSLTPAATRPHFAIGAQKKMVLREDKCQLANTTSTITSTATSYLRNGPSMIYSFLSSLGWRNDRVTEWIASCRSLGPGGVVQKRLEARSCLGRSGRGDWGGHCEG
jgi:hypothetical protein